MDAFINILTVLVILAIVVSGCIIAAPSAKVTILRCVGLGLAIAAFAYCAMITTSDGCLTFFGGMILAPIVFVLSLPIVWFLPKTRRVNVILLALLLLTPIAGLALGHYTPAPRYNDCP